MATDYKKEEKTAIDELRNRMKGIIDEELYADDDVFYRFLKARDFNIEKAEIMLKETILEIYSIQNVLKWISGENGLQISNNRRTLKIEHVQWRKKYDLKNIFQYKPSEILQKYFPFNNLGHDRDGCVLNFIPAGNIDWIGIYSLIKIDDIAKYLIYTTETDVKRLKSYREKTGKTADKIIYILDCKNLSFVQCTHKKVPTYFSLIYSLMKKFLPTTITSKLKAFSDEESWKEDILKLVDAEELPVFLGGKKTDPDGNPLCLSFINHSAPIPEEYFENKKKKMLSKLPDVQKVTIGRAAFHEVFIDVKEPDSLLEWEFETKSRDIGFGLFHDDGQGNKSEIVPIQRISADEFSESGICTCEKTGTYIVIFDNTYSLLRKKDLFYKISVIKPGEDLSPVE